MTDVIPSDSIGRAHGFKQVFWENGMLETQGEFIHGEPTGAHFTYYNSGVLDSYITYKDGARHGYTLELWYDGKLAWHGQYIKGLRHGTHIDHDDDGLMAEHTTYDMGVPVGLEIYYQGGIITEKTYHII